jgi:hypothetical protein
MACWRLEADVQQPAVDNGGDVWFSLADVACPNALSVLQQISPELVVGGQVAFFSDSGEQSKHFAVVHVTGILTPLVVPVSKLRTAGQVLHAGTRVPVMTDPQRGATVLRQEPDASARRMSLPDSLEDSPAPP